MEKETKRKQSFELRLMGNVLCRQLAVYESMHNGEIPFLLETEKALQTSIKELCTAILERIN